MRAESAQAQRNENERLDDRDADGGAVADERRHRGGPAAHRSSLYLPSVNITLRGDGTLFSLLQRPAVRFTVVSLLDATIAVTSLAFAMLLRFDFSIEAPYLA